MLHNMLIMHININNMIDIKIIIMLKFVILLSILAIANSLLNPSQFSA